jgi:sensor domain CHASE-containing protein
MPKWSSMLKLEALAMEETLLKYINMLTISVLFTVHANNTLPTTSKPLIQQLIHVEIANGHHQMQV